MHRNQKRRRAAREPAKWRAFEDGKTDRSSPVEHAGASVKPFLQPALSLVVVAVISKIPAPVLVYDSPPLFGGIRNKDELITMRELLLTFP